MIVALSLFLLGVGIVLIVSSIATPNYHGQGFPRYGAPTIRSLRIWPVAMGVLLVIAGVALFLTDKAG